MHIKRMLGLISVVILFFSMLGCNINTISKDNYNNNKNYLKDSDFFLYELAWINSDILIAKMVSREDKSLGELKGRVILWNHLTNEQKVIYEGVEMPGVLPHGTILDNNGLLYTFDGLACLVFDTSTFELKNIVEVPGIAGQFHPSINGEFVMRGPDGLTIYTPDNPEELLILKDDQDMITESGIPYTIFYEGPEFSSDGKWIAFYQMAADFLIPPRIGLISRDGSVEKLFDFDTATNFTWASDPETIIAINEGGIFKGPLEIKVFNILSGKTISALFDQPIENQKLSYMMIADTYDTKILLQAGIFKEDKQLLPLLLFDWNTGEKKFLTSIDYLSVSATFSPDGKTIAAVSLDEIEQISFIPVN